MPTRAQITVARNAGFCPGVKKAIDTVLELAKKRKRTIYTLGPLIHNKQVIETLKENDIHAIKDLSEIKDKGSILVIRAHGIPPEEEKRLRDSGVEVVDATCPLVKHVQNIIARHAGNGYDTVIVGDADHAEVVGLMGYTGGRGRVVSGPAEARRLGDLGRVNVVAQTTQEGDVFEETVEVLRGKAAELAVNNTICNPTRDRQRETTEMAAKSDLVIVVGGKNSANTARLFQICERLAKRAVHIEREDELEPEQFRGARRIFITAGASTPGWMIEKALERARELSGASEKGLAEKLVFWWKLAVSSGALTALAAVALSYACMKLEGVEITNRMLVLSGLFVLSLHLGSRTAGREGHSADAAKRILFIKFKSTTKLASFVAGALALIISATVTPMVFLLTGLFWSLGMLYPYKLPFGLEKFSSFPASKDILTALGWAFVCAYVPWLAEEMVFYKSTQLAILFAFLLVFTRSVLYGVSNVHNDLIVGRENYYKAVGHGPTYATLAAIFLFLESVLLLLYNMSWKPDLVTAIFAGLFYYLALIVAFYFRKIPERTTSETLIELQFLLLGLLTAAAVG